MNDSVKARGYNSPLRVQRAAQTRSEILKAARDLFSTHGYGATTVTQVAARAGVSVDTLYASVGRKPELMRAVIDSVLGGSDEPLVAEERTYVRQIRAAHSARDKIEIYAAALAELLPQITPLQEALKEAGRTDPACARAWTDLVERRSGNMLLFAQDLRATGELRDDVTDQQVADIVWSTNSVEYYLLLTQRGWSPSQFGALLSDLWTRGLLTSPA